MLLSGHPGGAHTGDVGQVAITAEGLQTGIDRLVLTHPMIIASAVEAEVAALAGAAKAVATSVAMRVAPTAWDSNLRGRRELKGHSSERVGVTS